MTLAGASSLQRAGWGSYREGKPTGKMSHFPLGAHIASCWKGEMPGGGEGTGEAAAHSPGGLLFKIMRHLRTDPQQHSSWVRRIQCSEQKKE